MCNGSGKHRCGARHAAASVAERGLSVYVVACATRLEHAVSRVEEAGNALSQVALALAQHDLSHDAEVLSRCALLLLLSKFLTKPKPPGLGPVLPR